MTRISWEEYFLRIAEAAALRGTCPSLRVGAVVVDIQHILISTGYNGSQVSEPHCDDDGCIIENGHCVRTIHAEHNALNFVPPECPETAFLTVYCTHKPCSKCEELWIYCFPNVKFIWRNDYPVQCPDRPICGTEDCVTGGRCRAEGQKT